MKPQKIHACLEKWLNSYTGLRKPDFSHQGQDKEYLMINICHFEHKGHHYALGRRLSDGCS
jgi:hypothetical protein